MVENRRAVTTRVSPSFLRIGQFELYGRRAAKGNAEGKAQLEMLTRHALEREYPDALREDDLQSSILAMLNLVSGRLAAMTASWLRVGYTQSNFNSDNCLVGGWTMDYGPFGFIEEYRRDWGMWIGSGEHFSFMNQPAAAAMNFKQLVNALLPLLDAEGRRAAVGVLEAHKEVSRAAVGRMYAGKLGFSEDTPLALTGHVWEALEEFMASHPTDYTIFYRELAGLLTLEEGGSDSIPKSSLPHPTSILAPAFYAPLTPATTKALTEWTGMWLGALAATSTPHHKASQRMRRNNPKFIPREWLLVEAYTAAETVSFRFCPLFVLHLKKNHPHNPSPPRKRLHRHRSSNRGIMVP